MSYASMLDDLKAGLLLAWWHGEVDPPYVMTEEDFAGYSHQEIYTTVQAMEPRALALLSDRWRGIGQNLADSFEDFTAGLRNATAGWHGVSRDSLAAASQAFARSGETLAQVARRVEFRVDQIAHVAGELQSRVPAPVDTSVSALPDPGAVLDADAAAIEAHAEAVRVMTELYSPAFERGRGPGANVPAFAAPTDPAPGFGDLGGDVPSVDSAGLARAVANDSVAESNSGVGNRSVAVDLSGPEQSDREASDPITPDATASERTGGRAERAVGAAESDEPDESNEPDESDEPERDRQDSRTEPADAVRATSVAPSTVPLADSPRIVADPAVRQSGPAPVVAHQPAQPNPVVAQSATAARPQTPTRGMYGPGMYPGGAAQRRDDDTEHKIPSYLITEENGRELVGELPKTAPPVFGARGPGA